MHQHAYQHYDATCQSGYWGYYALPAPRRTLRVVSHWSSQNLAGQVWLAWQLEKQDSFNSSYFLDGKKGNWTELEPGDHTPIFMAKKIVEGAWSKLCQLIGCAEVLVGYSIEKENTQDQRKIKIAMSAISAYTSILKCSAYTLQNL